MGPLTRPAARPHGSTAEVISGVNLVSRQLHAATRHRRSGTLQFASGLAEREGFEPPIRLPVCRISSAVHSTTLPPLRSQNWALNSADIYPMPSRQTRAQGLRRNSATNFPHCLHRPPTRRAVARRPPPFQEEVRAVA